MRILYVALSCGPNFGSEDAIGWHLPIAVARAGHDVTVLTREDKREEIQAFIDSHPAQIYPRFVYAPLGKLAGFCKGPLYSVRAILWCRSIRPLLERICAEAPFDIIHQITPVEFRALADCSGLNARTVVGPVGGGEYAPKQYRHYLKGEWHVELFRRVLNEVCVRCSSFKKRVKAIDFIYFANRETERFFEDHSVEVKTSGLKTEIGIDGETEGPAPNSIEAGELRILFVGRLVPRKGVELLLEACAKAGAAGLNFHLKICGDGKSRAGQELLAKNLGISDRVEFEGRVNRDRLAEFYRWANIVAMPSLRETGGTVIAEAISHHRPLICADSFGASLILDSKTAILLPPGSGADEYAKGLVGITNESLDQLNFDEPINDLLWRNKAKFYTAFYESMLPMFV